MTLHFQPKKQKNEQIQVSFGDVYIPEGFEPPSTQTLPPLISKSDDCSSDQIELIDTKTLKVSFQSGFSIPMLSNLSIDRECVVGDLRSTT